MKNLIMKRVLPILCVLGLVLSSLTVGLVKESKPIRAFSTAPEIDVKLIEQLVYMSTLLLAGECAGLSQKELIETDDISDLSVEEKLQYFEDLKEKGFDDLIDYQRSDPYSFVSINDQIYSVASAYANKIKSKITESMKSAKISLEKTVLNLFKKVYPDWNGEDYADLYGEGFSISEDGDMLISDAIVAALSDTALFQMFLSLDKDIAVDNTAEKYKFFTESENVTEQCNFTSEWWKMNYNNVLSWNAPLNADTIGLYSNINNVSFLDNYNSFFPCVFLNNGVWCIGFLVDQNINSSIGFTNGYTQKNSVGTTVGLGSQNLYISANGGYISISNFFSSAVGTNNFWIDSFAQKYGVEGLLEGDHVINVGSLANFNALRQLVLSGNYTLDEILENLPDGWTGQRTKVKESATDHGSTITKVINQGNTYTKTVIQQNADDETDTYTGVSLDTLTKGLASSTELLGETVTATVTYPDVSASADVATKIESDTDTENKDNTDSNNNNNDKDNENEKENDSDGKKPFVFNEDEDNSLTADIQWYERFPFCIPWDLYNAVKLLNANSKDPVFTIPFVYKRLHIEKEIEVDLTIFEDVRPIVWWFMRLIYILSLALITRNIIKG